MAKKRVTPEPTVLKASQELGRLGGLIENDVHGAVRGRQGRARPVHYRCRRARRHGMVDTAAPGRGTSPHTSREAASIERAHPDCRSQILSTALAVIAFAVVFGPASASGQFTIAGRKVLPQETNFAGVRHASPRYSLVVQINHDARLGGDLELGLVDEAYGSLLKQHRSAVVPVDFLPVVFVSDAKIARFGEGGRRRMFRWLEPELQKHSDIHVSPAAIFISDTASRDRDTLRSALTRGLAFLFDQRFRHALDSMDRPIPDKEY